MVVDVKILLEKGAYFGHKVSRTNPKCLKYVYKAENDVYLIDLYKTKDCIDKAVNFIKGVVKNEEPILVVGTKRVIKSYIEKICTENNIPYLNEKWIGGFFTNFPEIYKNIKKIVEWQENQKTGQLDSMIKHERAKLDKKMNKLLKIYKGVLTLTEIPHNILIIDVKKEKNALSESLKIKNQQILSEKKDLKILAIVDTNGDPNYIDYPIVMNDDSEEPLQYVLDLLLNPYIKK